MEFYRKKELSTFFKKIYAADILTKNHLLHIKQQQQQNRGQLLLRRRLVLDVIFLLALVVVVVGVVIIVVFGAVVIGCLRAPLGDEGKFEEGVGDGEGL